MANTKITSRVLADNAVLTANITDANVTTAKVADNAVTGDKVSDDVALAGNPTTTTQSAGNNTTRIATTAFVSTAVANLADSAPDALNTLNELAAAMGDDANFSTTITNSIAAKLPLAGGTMTGNIVMGDDTSIGIADDAERIEFDGAGDISLLGANVGIGTASPARNLHVHKASSGATSTSDSVLVIEDDDNTEISILGGSSSILAINFGHSGDANDAIIGYNTTSGSENMAFTVNAAERMRIDSSGNVGIGTTSAFNSAKLSVTGGVNGAHAVFSGQASRGLKISTQGVTSNDDAVSYDAQTSTGHHLFKIAGTERVRIDSSGKVGIGTTSPDVPLEVEATNAYVHLDGSNHAALFIDRASASYDNNVFFQSGGTTKWRFGQMGADDILQVRDEVNDNSNVLVLKHGGNVGIGTANPSETLHIKRADGTALIVESSNDQNNTGDRIAMEFRTDGSQGIAKIIGGKQGNYQGQSVRSGYLAFQTINANSYAERMRITSAGEVAINSTAALSQSMLSVKIPMSVTANAFVCQPDANGTANAAVFVNSSGSNAGYIQYTATTTTYATSSDYRMKENVVALSNATDRLKQLNPSRFNFIADADTTVDGFLAHEVQAVVPEAVTGTKDAVDADGNPEYQGIDQSKLVPLLVKTIQELEARIKTLEES